MSDLPWRLVTVDIDGTLTTVHGWRVIADHQRRIPEYERSNQRYYAREIGEDEHLRDLIRLAEGLSAPGLDRILEATPKLGGIGEAIVEMRRRGARVALLTHNPGFVGEWYRRRFGFDDFEGTDGPRLQDGEVLGVEAIHADKPRGMRRLIDRWSVPASRVVHVGDGWADAGLFPGIGAGVALNSRLEAVRRAATVALDARDLRELVPVLERLSPPD